VEPFVPPETPDPVPGPTDQPAKPDAIDSDFTPASEKRRRKRRDLIASGGGFTRMPDALPEPSAARGPGGWGYEKMPSPLVMAPLMRDCELLHARMLDCSID
jgi:hypothetical protein